MAVLPTAATVRLKLVGLGGTVLLDLRHVLPGFRMGFLELAGIVLSLGVALPVCVGVIRKITGAVDVAETAMTKAGIVLAEIEPVFHVPAQAGG